MHKVVLVGISDNMSAIVLSEKYSTINTVDPNTIEYIGSDPNRQPHYQLVEYFKYQPVLGSFNNWNIIQFTNKKDKLGI